MALVGTDHVAFLCFSKDKSLEFSVTWNKINKQLRPSHIISVNYLDLDQAYATHESQAYATFSYHIRQLPRL